MAESSTAFATIQSSAGCEAIAAFVMLERQQFYCRAVGFEDCSLGNNVVDQAEWDRLAEPLRFAFIAGTRGPFVDRWSSREWASSSKAEMVVFSCLSSREIASLDRTGSSIAELRLIVGAVGWGIPDSLKSVALPGDS